MHAWYTRYQFYMYVHVVTESIFKQILPETPTRDQWVSVLLCGQY